MTEASDLNRDFSGIMEELVAQFSDPHAFFRELIQNAIDAGSGEVEIEFDYDAAHGVMTVTVRDWGEGMSREIIERKLTRLFSSAKDADFTKIGKFGIGFVSVFAIAPDAVCVDTGRDAEFWRVLFSADRSYDLIRLPHPVEGTEIRVIKRLSEREYDAFRRRASEVVRFWCRHVAVPIVIDGEEINAPFDIDALIKVTHEEEGTRVVAGYIPSRQAPYGFYNRGLTLKEGDESPWPHVALKIDSRYLEHTLTRDQVLQDEHYHKAMALLSRIATDSLPRLVFEKCAECAHSGDLEAWEQWARFAWRYVSTDGDWEDWRRTIPIFPVVGGSPLSASDIAEIDATRGTRVYLAPRSARLAEVLWESGDRALAGGHGSTLEMLARDARDQVSRPHVDVLKRKALRLIDSYEEELVRLDEGYVWGERVLGAPRLLEEVARALHARGARCEEVALGALGGYRTSGEGRAAWLPDEEWSPMKVESNEKSFRVKDLLSAKRVVLNADEPRIARLVELSEVDLNLAAKLVVDRLFYASAADVTTGLG